MLLAVLLQRCPRCRRGPVFRGLLTMNARCPVCGRVHEREPGYFTGAMYVSYGLGLLVTMPVWFAMLLSGASLVAIMVVTGAALVIAFPFMFRYSRVLWMHFDVHFNGLGNDEGTTPVPPRR